jgi:8-oxo-dGTP pyrophosphatase MutT (NUDIX family)
MRKLTIVMGVIQQGEHYLLQLRNGEAKIGAAGLIGFFGGKIEPDEDPAKAICRELGEETNLSPKTHEVRLLGNVKVTSDHKLEPVEVYAHIFHIPIDPNIIVEALEGELVKLGLAEALEKLHLMTPGTRAYFEELTAKE